MELVLILVLAAGVLSLTEGQSELMYTCEDSYLSNFTLNDRSRQFDCDELRSSDWKSRQTAADMKPDLDFSASSRSLHQYIAVTMNNR